MDFYNEENAKEQLSELTGQILADKHTAEWTVNRDNPGYHILNYHGLAWETTTVTDNQLDEVSIQSSVEWRNSLNGVAITPHSM